MRMIIIWWIELTFQSAQRLIDNLLTGDWDRVGDVLAVVAKWAWAFVVDIVLLCSNVDIHCAPSSVISFGLWISISVPFSIPISIPAVFVCKFADLHLQVLQFWLQIADHTISSFPEYAPLDILFPAFEIRLWRWLMQITVIHFGAGRSPGLHLSSWPISIQIMKVSIICFTVNGRLIWRSGWFLVRASLYCDIFPLLHSVLTIRIRLGS